MSFTDTITAIMAAVAAEVSGTTHAVGAEHDGEHTAPPHVRWIPVADTVAAPPKISPLASHLQRALVGLETRFEVQCWGATYADTCALRDALLRATHIVCSRSAYATDGGAWARGGAITHGQMVTCRIAFRGYVAEAAPTVATVTNTAFDTSGAVQGDGEVFVPSDP